MKFFLKANQLEASENVSQVRGNINTRNSHRWANCLPRQMLKTKRNIILTRRVFSSSDFFHRSLLLTSEHHTWQIS